MSVLKSDVYLQGLVVLTAIGAMLTRKPRLNATFVLQVASQVLGVLIALTTQRTHMLLQLLVLPHTYSRAKKHLTHKQINH